MGTRSSQPVNSGCSACGSSTADADKINTEFWLCRRCGSYVEPPTVPKPKPKSKSFFSKDTNAPSPRKDSRGGGGGGGGGGYSPVPTNPSAQPSSSSSLSPPVVRNRATSDPPSASPSSASEHKEPASPRRQPHLRLRIVHLAPFFESLPEEDRGVSEEKWQEKYLKPYFSGGGQVIEYGTRFQINGVDWKVTSCFPPFGVTAPETIFRAMFSSISATAVIQKLHLLPVQASLNVAESKSLFEDHVKPYFSGPDQRHLEEGAVFLSRGVQFKVIAALPSSGMVAESTEFFMEGETLLDIERFQILPIYETLPNRDKQLDAQQRFSKYLEPFFLGRFQFITQGSELAIDGVDWKVVACDPPRGVVTYKTIIFAAGDALRAEDVKRQQLEDDEALARRLQRQEAGGLMPLFPAVPMVRGGGAMDAVGGQPMPNALVIPAGRSNSRAFRSQLQDILRLLPPDDRNRVVLQRLHDHLVLMPGGGGLVRVGAPENRNMGASPAEIDALPTRTFVPFDNTDQRSEELLKCMVCLSEFEKDEELRTLPCFHSYHKDCIDKWLAGSVKCPMCKNPIH